ncbi:MAG TPA: MBL fold metallo-hydrolase [Gaiellaceae bacterium]|nr:MBL fold metallo-hydrolase [Gaiellaceae bacterium]
MQVLDLEFGGQAHAIGVYLVDTDDGVALFDCGPASTLPTLEKRLDEQGLALTDVRHLLLSHIHLDHAGAAGTIARRHPQLTIWVSPVGAPHLVDPSRLERSARRLYGEMFDPLWGELLPVPEEQVRIAEGDVLGWDAFPTVGHAIHHVSYLRDGTLLAGDACGVRIPPGDYVLPVSPPPDFDLVGWHATAAEIRRRDPDRIALIHFGVKEDVAPHLDRLDRELDTWVARAESMSAEEFSAAARDDMGEDADLYDRVAPLWQSYAGLERYLSKRTA